ncbi:hypothetical protein [Thalassobacillus sp. CUG 92003]|uniref:hypothetical protein n=1 Tax=Thalassobacillus sp. CUG 92003 TaxID=2736641 RepID=UPI0015E6FEF7|nr:hypothetical protein [Thalassobacillus sp. CUG 92003]
MNQTLYSSILFLISAGIWAVLAFIYDDFRWLNIALFVIFLIMGLVRRKQFSQEKEWNED